MTGIKSQQKREQEREQAIHDKRERKMMNKYGLELAPKATNFEEVDSAVLKKYRK